MNRLLKPVLLALGLCLLTPVAVHAQYERAYAPENLRSLSYNDQVRVISLEYSEQSGGRRIADDQLRFYIDQVNRSNWGFSRIKQDIATSLAGGGVYPPVPPIGGNVTCESKSQGPRVCPTPYQDYSRLVRQISGSACVEGRTWWSQPGQVTVTGGCRAEFAARGVAVLPPPGGGYTVTCSSKDNRLTTCAWNTNAGRPQLVRQLSSQACVEGNSWGYNRRQGLWVTRGCRAQFAARDGGPVPIPGYSVQCTSSINATSTCAWDANRGRPYIIQVFNGPCVENQTWGYQPQRGSLWVRNACSARFGAR